MTIIKTWARHIVAVIMGAIAGWLVPVLGGLGFGPEEIDQLLTSIEVVFMFLIMAIVYVVVEKALKPFWRRYFGERQPGEVVKEPLGKTL